MKTKTLKRRRLKQHTARIHYGPTSAPTSLYWRVRVKDATQNVRINGSVLDAVCGAAGLTIGCHLSICAANNADAFPHPFRLAAFTKSTALIVTKVSRGGPTEAVRYRHNLGDIVELNDTDITKNYIKTHRHRIDRQLSLLAPRQWGTGKPAASPAGARKVKPASPRRRRAVRGLATVPKGALARAINAGLINKGVASAMRDYDTELLAA